MQYEQRPWAPRLLAISCLSLAAKMQGVANCSLVFLQVL
jgi:cyclin D6, plant